MIIVNNNKNLKSASSLVKDSTLSPTLLDYLTKGSRDTGKIVGTRCFRLCCGGKGSMEVCGHGIPLKGSGDWCRSPKGIKPIGQILPARGDMELGPTTNSKQASLTLMPPLTPAPAHSLHH